MTAWPWQFPSAATAPLAVQRIQLELLLEKTGPVRILSPIPFATPLAIVFYWKWASSLPLVWLGLFYAAVLLTYLRRRRLESERSGHREEPADESAAGRGGSR